MKNVLLLICICIAITCMAQQRKALIIGIDTYEIPEGQVSENEGRTKFPNLKGCKNDALAMRSVIVTRFGFDSSQISALYDRDATRAAILTAMDKLLNDCKKNDIAFIYYAGHGSQVKNSFSKEADKKDESIVPSDTWKKGVSDITDKELAKKFNAFVDKGIKLTVIFDCCHSGSLTRGIVLEQPLYRYMEASDFDTKDASEPTAPELRPGNDFLIMSAAQSNELAQEQMDANNMPHGAFTVALLNALNQQPANVSAARLFNSLRAILKSNGKKQEPVIGGSEERQSETLFGIDKAKLTGESFQVTSVRGSRVEFDAGLAQQLQKDNELMYVLGNGNKNDTVVVRIDEVTGISKSTANVVKGNASLVKAGLSFSLVNWVAPKSPLLSLYIPESPFTYNDIKGFASINASLKKDASVKWINELDKVEPELTYFFRGKNLYANTGQGEAIVQQNISASTLTKFASGKTCFLNLPPDQELVNQLKQKLATANGIAVVSDPLQANYILYGTINNANQAAYGFARSEIALQDSLDAMPLITDYITLAGNSALQYNTVADSLLEYSVRLAKVRGWMNLPGPKGSNNFPFVLRLRDDATGQSYDSAVAVLGRNVTLNLELEQQANTVAMATRYVYVFVIDKDARMQLLYPLAAGGNVENKFPVYENDAVKMRVPLISYQIGLPVGTDSYYMIATAEPISNLSLFNQEGIRTIGTRGADDNPVLDLLQMGNLQEVGTRGVSKLSADWTLSKMQVKTTH